MEPDNEHIENEWYVVRHSGEIPEIALNSSFYFLTRDKRGPQIVLSEDELHYLKNAAVERFREIIHRDIVFDNREKSIYRGIKRSIANWYRFESFCRRQNISPTALKQETAGQLVSFLSIVSKNLDTCNFSLNCSSDELATFVARLGLEKDKVPEKCSLLCVEEI